MRSMPGETTKALTLLARMMGAGERHPLQVMAVLHNHYGRLARLDGVDAGSEADAAEAMGIKPGFPAKKALANYQRLGGGGIQRAIQLLAQADLDLRGERDLPDDLVMEVLVARLSELALGLSRVDEPAASGWRRRLRNRESPLNDGSACVDLVHQAALLAGRRVGVDDALGGGHVDALDGEAHGLGVGVVADRRLRRS